MAIIRAISGGLIACLLLSACTGTDIESSWVNRDFKGKINKIYIIGISKNDINRVYFENTFYNKLKSEGVKSIPSSTNLPRGKKSSKDLIIQQMKENNCDAILLNTITNRETEAKFGTTRGSFNYLPGPYHSGIRTYIRPYYYQSWTHFYNTGYRVVSEPPSPTKVVVLTIESVLYYLKTDELVWSAKMETFLEEDTEKMINTFVNEVVKDLKETDVI